MAILREKRKKRNQTIMAPSSSSTDLLLPPLLPISEAKSATLANNLPSSQNQKKENTHLPHSSFSSPVNEVCGHSWVWAC